MDGNAEPLVSSYTQVKDWSERDQVSRIPGNQ